MEQTGPVAAVILAAGAATRFGSPKQNLLLPAVLRGVEAAGLTEIVVVAGAHTIDVAIPATARLVDCPAWADGPGASLRCGLSELRPETAAAVVVLADGPHVDPRAIGRVVAAWRRGDGTILAASYDGERDHPVVLARTEWENVPTDGGRALAASLVDCSDLPEPGDVDTEQDLERLSGNSNV